MKLIIDKNNALVDGEEIELDTKAIIKDGRTFVPLRFVSEALGANVEWNGETRTIFITAKDLKDDGMVKDFIEPEFLVKPQQANTKLIHCTLRLTNYQKFVDSGDEYYFNVTVLSDDKMNQSYTQIGQDWPLIDFTEALKVRNSLVWDFRKFYLTEKNWDVRYKTEIGYKVKLKVAFHNRTKEIKKDYFMEVEALKHLYGE